MSENGRKTCWCFTVNNPGAWRPLWQPTEMAYLCYEIERGEQGTEHVQGYVRFKTRKAFSTAKHLIANEAHLEPAKGTEEQNKEYCSKEKNGTFTEHGEYKPTEGAKRQGQRSDLEVALKKLKEGTPKRQVFAEHPNLLVKYPSGMEKAAEILMGPVPTQRDVHVTILWGETGTGKSHRVRTAFPDAYCCVPEPVGTFDNYSGQSVVIMDEFDPVNMPVHVWNCLADKWAYEIKCRYANKQARWTHLIVCSNWNPMTWYATALQSQRSAAERRMQPPIGRVYEVLSREQEVNLQWWLDISVPASRQVSILGDPRAVGSSTALPAPVPMSQVMSQGVKRTGHPSPTSSPSSEPLKRRPRMTSGEDSSQSADGSQEDPINIDD